jgi:mRNA-degrading endonuclease RelE of RelBE toxin-antitoxin system/PHD/YefM family antitoxin component YafN of YafNO toxin-antitoxin module
VNRVNLLDLPEDARDLIRECEARGERTLFERNGRAVAVLVSYDEYLALRETIDLVNAPLLYAKIETAEEEVRRGKMMLVEDLFGSSSEVLGSSEFLGVARVPPEEPRNPEEPRGTLSPWNDRLRIAEAVEGDWNALDAAERELVHAALRRIDDDPIAGAPLFEPLKGLWSYRAEGVRIVYRIVAEGRFVAILNLGRAAAS